MCSVWFPPILLVFPRKSNITTDRNSLKEILSWVISKICESISPRSTSRLAGQDRRADQQRHRADAAGALAVSRSAGRRAARVSCLPTSSTPRDASTIFRSSSARWRRRGRFTASVCSASRKKSSIVGINAQSNPIAPKIVDNAPVHEDVHIGRVAAWSMAASASFPIPISTPGYDCAPFTTASHWFTKDPETGIINVGNYRGHIKSPTRTGVFLELEQSRRLSLAQMQRARHSAASGAGDRRAALRRLHRAVAHSLQRERTRRRRRSWPARPSKW